MRERPFEFGESFEKVGGLYLPANTTPVEPSRPVGVDLFCGAGGFSLGFHQAGWHVAAAADGWAEAAWTYLLNLGAPQTLVHCVGELPEGTKRVTEWHKEHRGKAVPASEFFTVISHKRGDNPANDLPPGGGWIANHPGEPACEHFYLGDVRELTGEKILSDLDVEKGDVGCVFGGPPCQGFSMAGKREVMDPRNSLVFDFMRRVCEIKPMAFVMENVPGILSMVTPEGLPVIDALARVAEDGGYGTYDAIKRALLANADAGGALRSVSGGGRTWKGEEEAEREADQMELAV